MDQREPMVDESWQTFPLEEPPERNEILVILQHEKSDNVPAIPMTKAGEIGWPSSPYLNESIEEFAILEAKLRQYHGGLPWDFKMVLLKTFGPT